MLEEGIQRYRLIALHVVHELHSIARRIKKSVRSHHGPIVFIQRRQTGEARSARHVPQFCLSIGAAAGEYLSVAIKGDRGNPIRVPVECLYFDAQFPIPDFYRTIPASGRQSASILTEGYRLHDRREPGESANFTGTYVPEVDGRVHAARREGLSIGPEGERLNPVRMATQRAQQLAARHIPKFDRRIAAGAGNRLSVRSEGNHAYGVDVACQRVQLRTGGDVPYFYSLVIAPTCQKFIIRAESDAVD